MKSAGNISQIFSIFLGTLLFLPNVSLAKSPRDFRGVNLFTRLGLSQNATPSEIQKSWDSWSRLYAQSRLLRDSKFGKQKFQEICEAASLLLDPEFHRAYHLQLTHEQIHLLVQPKPLATPYLRIGISDLDDYLKARQNEIRLQAYRDKTDWLFFTEQLTNLYQSIVADRQTHMDLLADEALQGFVVPDLDSASYFTSRFRSDANKAYKPVIQVFESLFSINIEVLLSFPITEQEKLSPQAFFVWFVSELENLKRVSEKFQSQLQQWGDFPTTAPSFKIHPDIIFDFLEIRAPLLADTLDYETFSELVVTLSSLSKEPSKTRAQIAIFLQDSWNNVFNTAPSLQSQQFLYGFLNGNRGREIFLTRRLHLAQSPSDLEKILTDLQQIFPFHQGYRPTTSDQGSLPANFPLVYGDPHTDTSKVAQLQSRVLQVVTKKLKEFRLPESDPLIGRFLGELRKEGLIPPDSCAGDARTLLR